MIAAERIGRCIAAHPDWEDRRVAKATSTTVTEVRDTRSGHSKLAPKQTGGITRAEFMSLYDPTTKVRNTLSSAIRLIEKGQFYKDHELRKMAGCGDPALWRSLANDPDEGFTKYQFRMGDQIWWTDPNSASEIVQTHAKARQVA